jgi:DNA-binding NarL/FixJ family response regulator
MGIAPPATLSVLIVDDHQGFRLLARSLLLKDRRFEVTAEAVDGEEAIDAVRQHRPDVVLLDVQLPGMDGFEVAEQLADMADPPSVVMTSMRTEFELEPRLTAAPIAGFVPKQELSGGAVAAVLEAA